MSILVWLVTFFALYYGIADPQFHPSGFAEVFTAIVICWLGAEVAQGIFEGVTGR